MDKFKYFLKNAHEITSTTSLLFCLSSVLWQQLHSQLCVCYHALKTNKNPTPVVELIPYMFLTGFTLLELMIIIAIVGIITSLAIPSYQQTIEINRIKQVAQSLLSDIQSARTQAIKLSQNTIVSSMTGNNGNWCYGFNIADVNGDGLNDPCNCSQSDSDQIDYCSLKKISGTEFEQTNLTSDSANTTFNFRRGTANSGNLCISTINYKLKIIINNAGKIAICNDRGARYPVPGYENCNTNCP